MKFNIAWAFFLEVATPRKCQKMVEKMSESLAYELCNVEMERYWKDDTLYKVTALSSFDAPTSGDGLHALLTKLNRLARFWFVGGPDENQPWTFAGTATKDSFRISGINVISFDCSTEPIISASQLPAFGAGATENNTNQNTLAAQHNA